MSGQGPFSFLETMLRSMPADLPEVKGPPKRKRSEILGRPSENRAMQALLAKEAEGKAKDRDSKGRRLVRTSASSPSPRPLAPASAPKLSVRAPSPVSSPPKLLGILKETTMANLTDEQRAKKSAAQKKYLERKAAGLVVPGKKGTSKPKPTAAASTATATKKVAASSDADKAIAKRFAQLRYEAKKKGVPFNESQAMSEAKAHVLNGVRKVRASGGSAPVASSGRKPSAAKPITKQMGLSLVSTQALSNAAEAIRTLMGSERRL